jgi:hypothetical protein
MPALEKKVEGSALGSGTEVVNRLVSMGMARLVDVKVGKGGGMPWPGRGRVEEKHRA